MIGEGLDSERHPGNDGMGRKEYAFRKAYIRELWRSVGREHKVVCLFGAGKHTRWLLDTVRGLPGPDIEAVFDEQPKSQIDGIPVLFPDRSGLTKASAVIISSDHCEDALTAKAKFIWGDKVKIIAPYELIGTGPFAGEETECWCPVASRERLLPFKNRHAGQTAFILGNGPSLRKTNLALLKSRSTFGLNRIYLLFPELGFQTTYYCCINSIIIEQCAPEINAIDLPRFLGPAASGRVSDTEDTIYLSLLPDNPIGFSRDPASGLWQGATVTYAALQLAFYMGFNPVVLTGVDHSFKNRGDPHSVQVSQEADTDHFSPDYFGPGFKWNLPDLEMSEIAYRIALYNYRRSGREVFDATVDGHLTVFPKRELHAFV